jgi:hypothetical protein
VARLHALIHEACIPLPFSDSRYSSQIQDILFKGNAPAPPNAPSSLLECIALRMPCKSIVAALAYTQVQLHCVGLGLQRNNTPQHYNDLKINAIQRTSQAAA